MANVTEEDGPGMGGVLFAGILTLILGMFLGSITLVTQNVDSLTREPDPDSLKPGKVVYIKGTRSGRTNWRGKEQAWKAGQLSTLILTEVELNQWSNERLKPSPVKTDEEEGSWLDMLKMAVTPVNFRITENRLQMATEIEFPSLLPGHTYLYMATGHFNAHPGGVDFVQESGSLGQAPIGCVPAAGDWFLSMVGKNIESTEELDWLVDAFGDLESAEITDGQLILRRKTEG